MNTVFRVLKIWMKKHLLRRRAVAVLLLISYFSLSSRGFAISDEEFFNLTATEVSIDSLLPRFEHTWSLGTGYKDANYTVSIEYPEFIDMSAQDIARLKSITDEPLPALPVVETTLGVSRKNGMLHASLVPLVFRDGKYQKLVSFKLKVKGERRGLQIPMTAREESILSGDTRAEEGDSTDTTTPAAEESSRYAAHSVLATGQWAKISVEQTGIHQLTESLVRQCGFSNLNKVKIYGYGGALQPEVLTEDYLKTTDDLREVPTYTTTGGRRLFHAVGPVIRTPTMVTISSPRATMSRWPSTVPHLFRPIPPTTTTTLSTRWTTMPGITVGVTFTTNVCWPRSSETPTHLQHMAPTASSPWCSPATGRAR